MSKFSIVRRAAAAAAAATSAIFIAAGPAIAPAAAESPNVAQQLLDAARRSGNHQAASVLSRAIDQGRINAAIPGQPFQIPAHSDIGRMDPATGSLYGSGIALNVNGGFQFGFFGGPGTFAPNQTGADLQVIWLNLNTGVSGSAKLIEHADIPVDTTIRTAILNPGGGTIVAAIYGSAWHRFPVPKSPANPDGFAYVKATINFPSLGSVIN